jgi:hypothetical protein
VWEGTEAAPRPAGEKEIIRGRVLDARTGAPLPEFEVGLVGGEIDASHPMAFSSPRRVVDAGGGFSLSDPPASAVTVTARAAGFAPAARTLPAGERRDGEDIVFRLEPAVRLRGHVLAAGGAPVSGALVFVGSGHTIEEIVRRPAARTGDDGGFALDLPPGVRTAGAFHPDLASAAFPVVPDMVIVLPGGGGARGRVARGGSPAEKAMVLATYPGREDLPGASAPVREDGSYEIAGLAPGAVEVKAALDGFTRTSARRIAIASGSVATLDIDVPAGDSVLEGTVTEGGSPPAIAVVFLDIHTSSGEEGYRVRAESSGAFRFAGLPAGEAKLTAHVAGGPSAGSTRSRTIEFDIAAGSAERRDVEFESRP